MSSAKCQPFRLDVNESNKFRFRDIWQIIYSSVYLDFEMWLVWYNLATLEKLYVVWFSVSTPEKMYAVPLH